MAVDEERRQKTLTSRVSPDFGAWVAEQRRQLGMTNDELATACGFSRSTLINVQVSRKQEAAWPVALFEGLAQGLGLELGYVLYKAGFNLGPDGIDMARLARVERFIEAFGRSEHQVRSALVEAMDALDEGPQRVELGRALLAVDLLAERLRTDRVEGGSRPVREHGHLREPQRARKVRSLHLNPRSGRGWTAGEWEFLRAHPELSPGEVGKQLDRTSDAVRFARRRLREAEENKSNEGGGL